MRPLPHLRILAGSLAICLALVASCGTGAAMAKTGRQVKTPTLRVHQHVKVATTSASSRCTTGRRSGRESGRTRSLRQQLRRARNRTSKRQAQRRLRTVLSRLCGSAPRTTYSAAPSSIYWGAWIGTQLTGTEAPWDMDAVEKFEQMAGKKASLVHFASPFSNCYSDCYFYDFPTEPMESVREHGSIPFFSWSSQSIPSQTSEPDYQLADVAGGAYDGYIRDFARDAAAWGHPFFRRFNWEMNGDWFPWGAAANGNSAADYVAAWRHVHDIFTSVGATNATWTWCPNVDPGGSMVDLTSLYPGDTYVDWTCLDGYNWGTHSHSGNEWASFDELYRSTYDEIVNEIAPSKPMIIGETSASEYGGSKADWIADALSKVPSEYPQIRGMLWFEKYDDGMDWPIETSSAATSAFAGGIQNPAYATNSFTSLSTGGPIQPSAG
jgi:hypothetical protein